MVSIVSITDIASFGCSRVVVFDKLIFTVGAVICDNHSYLYALSKAIRAYENMTIECFLDGHVRAFEYFGGYLRRIAYDNLKTAVIKVPKKGKRRLKRRFIELKSWYLFDTRLCIFAKGNEKGDIENLAKRSERQFFSPVPSVTSKDELNEML